VASDVGTTGDGASVVPRRVPDVVWVTVDDEIVVLDASGRAQVITSTGALLWPLLDGVATVGELAADVADVFGIEPELALADVCRFVDEMVAMALIVGAPEGEEGP
jgi:hypothetical protein